MYDFAAIASSAKEILAKDGWNKGFLTEPGTTTHCVGGALNLAMTDGASDSWIFSNNDAAALYKELAQIITDQFPARSAKDPWITGLSDAIIPDINVIARFNNHADTTRAEISSILDSLAEKELAHVG